MYSNNIKVLSTIVGSDVTAKANKAGTYKVIVLNDVVIQQLVRK